MSYSSFPDGENSYPSELALHKQMLGDEHSTRGLRYECAFRCVWMLDLRGEAMQLSVAEGEDVKLWDGTRATYRQVKKKESGYWTFSELKPFLVNAFTRFCQDRTVLHEFYTNASASDKFSRKGWLNPSHSLLREMLSTRGARPEEGVVLDFCRSVRFFFNSGSPDLCLDAIQKAVRRRTDEEFTNHKASDFITPHEINPIVGNLLRAESELWLNSKSISWPQLEPRLEFNEFVQRLTARSLGGLKSWSEVLSSRDIIPDEGTRAAIGAIVSGK